MKRSVLFVLVPVALFAVGAAFAPAMAGGDVERVGVRLDEDDDGGGDEAAPCKTTDFKHDAIKEACAKGGQKEAKKVMKAFVAAAKKATGEKITCKTCHSGLSPDYALKDDAHQGFEKFDKAIKAAPATK
jgi:hypothetical protein